MQRYVKLYEHYAAVQLYYYPGEKKNEKKEKEKENFVMFDSNEN